MVCLIHRHSIFSRKIGLSLSSLIIQRTSTTDTLHSTTGGSLRTIYRLNLPSFRMLCEYVCYALETINPKQLIFRKIHQKIIFLGELGVGGGGTYNIWLSYILPSHNLPNHILPSHILTSHILPSHILPSHILPSSLLPR